MILKIILTILYFLVLYNLTFVEIIDIYTFNSRSIGYFLFVIYLVISILWLIFTKFYLIRDKIIKNELNYTFKSIFFLYLFLIIWFFISQEYLIQNRTMLTETKLSWNLSFIFLSLWLLISPILTFIKTIKIRDYLILFRKLLWILVVIILLRHVVDFFQSHYPYWDGFFDYFNYFISTLESPVIWSWTIGSIFLLLLWITSNKFSVRKIWAKFWKRLHFLVFPAYFFSMLHVYYLWRLDWFYWWITVVIILARIIATIARRHRRKKIWKATKYLCPPCWFIYDEKIWDIDWWLKPWTKFDDIPDDWYCPVCWARKSDFIPYYDTEDIIFWGSLLKVIKTNLVTKDVIHLILQWDKNIECLPWQYVWLVMQDSEGEFIRSYSIVSNRNKTLEFYIKLKYSGRAWKVLQNISVWDYLKITWVYGDFVLKETENRKVFIATGTGISPIIHMIMKNTFSEKNKLFFWIAKREDLFWLDRLGTVPNIEKHIFLSQEKKDWYHYGRINIKGIKFQKNTEFYICWNPDMVEETENILRNNWYEHIFFEKFN